MIHLELWFLCELDGVEGVHLATAAAAAQVTVQQQPELVWTNRCMYIMIGSGRNTGQVKPMPQSHLGRRPMRGVPR